MRRCLLLEILIITSTRPECAPHAVAVRIVWNFPGTKRTKEKCWLCAVVRMPDCGSVGVTTGGKQNWKWKKKQREAKYLKHLKCMHDFVYFSHAKKERINGREPVRGNSFARKTIQWTRLEWSEEKTHWHTHTHIGIEVTLAEEMPSKSHDKKERKKVRQQRRRELEQHENLFGMRYVFGDILSVGSILVCVVLASCPVHKSTQSTQCATKNKKISETNSYLYYLSIVERRAFLMARPLLSLFLSSFHSPLFGECISNSSSYFAKWIKFCVFSVYSLREMEWWIRCTSRKSMPPATQHRAYASNLKT